jgi:hypothetical protein
VQTHWMSVKLGADSGLPGERSDVCQTGYFKPAEEKAAMREPLPSRIVIRGQSGSSTSPEMAILRQLGIASEWPDRGMASPYSSSPTVFHRPSFVGGWRMNRRWVTCARSREAKRSHL